jgi:molybdopterin/thiamine biosynthesis adenylyltransferase
MALRDDQVRRYARHVLLPDIGGHGQARLLASSVQIAVGPGRAAGEVAAIYLAAGGVGTLILDGDAPVARDDVERSLPFGTADIGRDRRFALADRIAAINPDVVVRISDVPNPVALDVAPVPLPLIGPPVAGAALADALIAGGAAAARLLHLLASPPGRTP